MEAPEKYQLSPENKKFERDELRFQREMNSKRFFTWAKVVRQIKPERTYQVYDGFNKQVGRGDDLLEKIHRRVLHHSCTGLISITQVPDGYQQPVTDLWNTYRDPKTGRIMVNGHQYDVWETDQLTQREDAAREREQFPMDEETAQILGDIIVQQRSTQRRCDEKDVLEKAREAAVAAVKQSYSLSIAGGKSEEAAMTWAPDSGAEAFDRAYGRERMLKRGIPLDRHPEWRTYQTFFELGMAPPTHEEMADYIIQKLTPEEER